MANLQILRCVKEIGACQELSVGDRLWRVASEIRPGGYEYVVTWRLSDHAIIKFRVGHLDDCFELEEVPIEDYMNGEWQWT